jgi:hypothetical protein
MYTRRLRTPDHAGRQGEHRLRPEGLTFRRPLCWVDSQMRTLAFRKNLRSFPGRPYGFPAGSQGSPHMLPGWSLDSVYSALSRFTAPAPMLPVMLSQAPEFARFAVCPHRCHRFQERPSLRLFIPLSFLIYRRYKPGDAFRSWAFLGSQTLTSTFCESIVAVMYQLCPSVGSHNSFESPRKGAHGMRFQNRSMPDRLLRN